MNKRRQSMKNQALVKSIFPGMGITDPHVLVDGDKIYMICGHDKTWEPVDTWLMDKWIILVSNDLIHWEKCGEILPEHTYIGNEPNCWAGNLKKRGNKYYWYFSNKNYSTGVVVADKVTGPYKDLLKGPLITANMVPHSKPYDPTILMDQDEYYIIVGAGIYYIAKLNEDMSSLAEPLRPIAIYDDRGNLVKTSDKSSLIYRSGLYYLIWGGHYAMAQHLYGPYHYIGEYNKDCKEHNDFFTWKGKDYIVSEFPETNIFYRGVELAEIQFEENGEIKPLCMHGQFEKKWTFLKNEMGFHGIESTRLLWNSKKYIEASSDINRIGIESSLWPGMRCQPICYQGKIIIKNTTDAKSIQIEVETSNDIEWLKHPTSSQGVKETINIKITAECSEWKEYLFNIPLSGRLKRITFTVERMCNKGTLNLKSFALHL